MRSSEASKEVVCGLLPYEEYKPTIEVNTEVEFQDEDTNPTISQTCDAKEFIILAPWKCADNRTEIPRSFLCDDFYDCPDQSDEEETNCKGSNGTLLLAIISTILVIGLVLSWPGE